MTRVRFDNSEYRRSHGRDPRGWGCWIFSFDQGEDFWTRPMNYGEAKKQAAQEARQRGAREVRPQP